MLAKVDLPVYDLELPVTKEKIKFRPFTVKEYKILLFALESADQEQIINATMQIVNNCLVDCKLDVEQMANYNIEYILLNMRAAAISEKLTIHFSGLKESECESCQKKKVYQLNLNDVKVDVPQGFSNKVELECGYKVIMKEPSYPMIALLKSKIDENKFSIDDLFSFTAMSIKQIIKGEEIYQEPEITLQDKIEFVENLPLSDFYLLEKFYEKMPTLRHKIEFKCPECENPYEYVLEGINDFLD